MQRGPLLVAAVLPTAAILSLSPFLPTFGALIPGQDRTTHLDSNGAQLSLGTLELAVKAAVAAVGAAALRRLRIVRPFPGLSWGAAKLWAPVAVLYCARQLASRAAARANPFWVSRFGFVVPVAVVTCVGDRFVYGSKPERLSVAALTVMLGGAALSAWQDASGPVNLAGLFWVALTWLFSSGFVLYLRFATENINVSIFGMAFVNSVLGIVIALPIAVLNGEMSLFLRTEPLHTFDYVSSLLLVGLALLFLTCAILNCVAATGPTTYAVLAAVVSVAYSFNHDGAGWIYESAMVGGLLYSCAKLHTSVAAGDAGWAGEMLRARFAATPLSQDEPEAEPPLLQLPDQV
jgi:hypothetical protein